MQFRMNNLDQLSLSEMEELLSSSRKVTWQTEDSAAKYSWIASVLKAQRYGKLGKREKGVVRRFLQKDAAQRHRSSFAHAKGQARYSSPRSPSVLTRRRRLPAPVSPGLSGEGGSSAAPFPLDQGSRSSQHRILDVGGGRRIQGRHRAWRDGCHWS